MAMAVRMAAECVHPGKLAAVHRKREVLLEVCRAALEDLLRLRGGLEPIDVLTREELCDEIVPSYGGLALVERDRRAAFLPVVWCDLSNADQFVRALDPKAGLSSA
jgi:hypothetical protein